MIKWSTESEHKCGSASPLTIWECSIFLNSSLLLFLIACTVLIFDTEVFWVQTLYKSQTYKDNEGESVFVCVCMSPYLVGHLVGPHGHLFHGHVFHVAAFLFGRPPCGTELDFLRPGRGADFKGHSLTSHQRASIIMKRCDFNKSDTEHHWSSAAPERSGLKFLSNVLLLLQKSISHLAPWPCSTCSWMLHALAHHYATVVVWAHCSSLFT